MRRLVIIQVLLVVCMPACAQRTSIAFWNVENLFDTIRSPFYDDSEFTPRGTNRWDTERYRTKIENLARVIDQLGADIVGLAEVENEAVVRDLVMALKTDYNYIHRTSGDSRGIDLALLYKGDRFFPDSGSDGVRLVRSGMGREFLHVRGELATRNAPGNGIRVDFVVCHMASKLNSVGHRTRNMQALKSAIERLLAGNGDANIVVMGDMNSAPDEKIVRQTLGEVSSKAGFMYAPHAVDRKSRSGSYNYRGKWYLYDWMMVSPAMARGTTLKVTGAGVYARGYMTEPASASGRSRTGAPPRPRRTFSGGKYRAGYSDHFPVWITVVQN